MPASQPQSLAIESREIWDSKRNGSSCNLPKRRCEGCMNVVRRYLEPPVCRSCGSEEQQFKRSMGSEHARMHKLQQKFKLRGFSLTVDAAKEFSAFLDESNVSLEEAIEDVVSRIDTVSLKSNVIGKEALDEIIQSIKGVTGNDSSVLKVIDAFEIPKFCYDPSRKVFHQFPGKLSIHGDASSKANLYRDRIMLLHQRLARDKLFSKPAFGTTGSQTGSCQLTALQSLVGCSGIRWVMGAISQLEDGRFFLEDLTASVPIDVADAKITAGFFTENCVVVAEGVMQVSGTFKISSLGFPPLEHRQVSLGVTAGMDFFGGGALSTEEVLRLEAREQMARNDMFVVISEIWLDRDETMKKLEKVLKGYESVEIVPSLFILMGNFCSQPCNRAFNNFAELRLHFKTLGSMIAACPRITQQSRFLFVPGPDDPGPAKVLPRPRLPSYFVNDLAKLVPNAMFTSNPCRIRYYSQEIVLFRQEMVHRMRRACLIPPAQDETKDLFEHFVATVTHQSHLCPLPLYSVPVIWNYDHALRLYPTPHTLVLADKSPQRSFNYVGVTAFNPGPFNTSGTFIVYRPASKTVELSGV